MINFLRSETFIHLFRLKISDFSRLSGLFCRNEVLFNASKCTQKLIGVLYWVHFEVDVRRDLLNFVGPSRSISVVERFHITSRGHVVVLNNGGHVSVPNKSCWSVLKWDVIF